MVKNHCDMDGGCMICDRLFCNGKGGIAMDDRCIVCGEIIPEGRHVCPICEKAASRSTETDKKIELRDVTNSSQLVETIRRLVKSFIRRGKTR